MSNYDYENIFPHNIFNYSSDSPSTESAQCRAKEIVKKNTKLSPDNIAVLMGQKIGRERQSFSMNEKFPG
jgi:hypothetical protein